MIIQCDQKDFKTINAIINDGIKLLAQLCSSSSKPILIGTWADAAWAIAFYQKHGFHLVSNQEKEMLLRKYWTIPIRQIETSVVLAGNNWKS